MRQKATVLCIIILYFFILPSDSFFYGMADNDSCSSSKSNADGNASYHIVNYVIGSGGIIGTSNANYLHSATAGQTLVGEVLNQNNVLFSGFWHHIIPVVPVVDQLDNEVQPTSYELHQNYPNPFNPTTTIAYSLPESEHVRLVIYSVIGRHIKTLVDTHQQSGNFKTSWDGKNERNMPVPTGVYFCHMEARYFVKVIKVALVK